MTGWYATASAVAVRNGVMVMRCTYYFVPGTCLYSSLETLLGLLCDHGIDVREMSHSSARRSSYHQPLASAHTCTSTSFTKTEWKRKKHRGETKAVSCSHPFCPAYEIVAGPVVVV